jgi:uncharacterized Tic20 family protein
MITEHPFDDAIDDHEAEKASNSYLMSLLALLVGLPLPIVNLIATLAFYFGNLRSSYFVRWHCTQALLSQVSVFVVNSLGLAWTLRVIFTEATVTNSYIAYLIVALLFNLFELIGTTYAAIQTRKGKHVVWFFYGPLTDTLCKP